jgi:NAD(P)-dependent dehydrogenase (short-subunit alcohol dehydrogenase family)
MGATVVMACRDKERGAAAAAEVRSTSGNPAVFLMQLDLASQESVRAFAQQFGSRFQRPDVLINNAAVKPAKREFTKDKIVTTFAVNYLSHFLLTNLLLARLKASAPSRIVNVTCSVHVEGHIDFRNLQVKKKYTQPKAYAQSKLAMVLFTYELARRLQGTGVTANCADPGDTETNLGPQGSGIWGAIAKLTGSSSATPEEGAETSIYLASSPALVGVSGKYFAKREELESSAESHDEAEAKRLWKESEKLAKLS